VGRRRKRQSGAGLAWLCTPDRGVALWGGVPAAPRSSRAGGFGRGLCWLQPAVPTRRSSNRAGNDACLSTGLLPAEQAAQEGRGPCCCGKGPAGAGGRTCPARSRLRLLAAVFARGRGNCASQRARRFGLPITVPAAGSTAQTCSARVSGYGLSSASGAGAAYRPAWEWSQAHAHGLLPRPDGAQLGWAILLRALRWSGPGQLASRNGAAGCWRSAQPRSLSLPAQAQFSALAQFAR